MTAHSDFDQLAIIIGAMKSGTTSLFNYLAQHPEVCESRIKEPGFFAFDDEWSKGPAHYFDLWSFDPRHHKLALEATTQYTIRPLIEGVPERMASLGGVRFKFIYVMRHPLRRIESELRHLEMWGESREKRAAIRGATGSETKDRFRERVLNLSRYAYQLDAYREFFERGDLFLLTLEQLQTDPDAVLDDLCGFLGLSRFDFKDTDRVHNPKRPYKPHPLWYVLRRARPLHRFVTERVPKGLRDRFRSVGAEPLRDQYSLTPEEEIGFLEGLKPDIRRLRDEYGVDVEGHWGVSLED